MNRSRLGYGLALALLVVIAAVVAVGGGLDPQARQVTTLVRDYLGAIERRDLEGAMGFVEPEQRARWRDFVANQLGDRHTVQGVSVKAPSLLDRWVGRQAATATSAFIFVEVNPRTPEGWRTTTLVRLTREDERWYFVEPPLWPGE